MKIEELSIPVSFSSFFVGKLFDEFVKNIRQINIPPGNLLSDYL